MGCIHIDSLISPGTRHAKTPIKMSPSGGFVRAEKSRDKKNCHFNTNFNETCHGNFIKLAKDSINYIS